MADKPPQSVDQFVSKEPPADHEDTNWGEDWESAFQAEDDAFFSEEKEEDFFLEENEPQVTTGAGTPGLDSSLEKTLAGIPDQGVAPPVQPAKPFAGAGALSALLLSGKAAAHKQFSRLQSFPLFVRLPLYGLPLLLSAALFFVLSDGPKPGPARKPDGAALSPDQATRAAGTPDEASQASRLHPGKVRKKWAFPAFIIPVNNPAADQPVIFVLVDITLIASLGEEEEPPADKKLFVRDIIYQFFQNKPLEELRRFSLARGEMNKELRAWLRKQWPEAPVESIIFHQYHLS